MLLMTHLVPYLAALLIFPLAGLHGADAPALKPVTSDPFVTIHPICTAASHDSPNPTVLGCGLARISDGAVLSVYSTPTGYYSKPGTTWIAGRVTKDGGKTWPEAKATTIDATSAPGHLTRLADGRIALV